MVECSSGRVHNYGCQRAVFLNRELTVEAFLQDAFPGIRRLLFGAIIVLLLSSFVEAEDGMIVCLPEGLFVFDVTAYTETIDGWFDDAETKRDLGYEFDDLDITEEVSEDIREDLGLPRWMPLPVERAFTSMKAYSVVDYASFYFAYGITDKLTCSLAFGWITEAYSSVDFNACVEIEEAFSPPLKPGYDITEAVQQDIQQEYGWNRIESWSGGAGFADTEIDFLYKFFGSSVLDAALQSHIVLPTGKIADEKNLFEIGYGDGNFKLGGSILVDIKPIRPVTISLLSRYIWNSQFHRGIYTDSAGDSLLSGDILTSHRFGSYKQGNSLELKAQVSCRLFWGISLFSGFEYCEYGVSTLDGEDIMFTERTSRIPHYGIRKSFVEAFENRRFRLPLEITFETASAWSGRNIEETSRYQLGITLIL